MKKERNIQMPVTHEVMQKSTKSYSFPTQIKCFMHWRRFYTCTLKHKYNTLTFNKLVYKAEKKKIEISQLFWMAILPFISDKETSFP